MNHGGISLQLSMILLWTVGPELPWTISRWVVCVMCNRGCVHPVVHSYIPCGHQLWCSSHQPHLNHTVILLYLFYHGWTSLACFYMSNIWHALLKWNPMSCVDGFFYSCKDQGITFWQPLLISQRIPFLNPSHHRMTAAFGTFQMSSMWFVLLRWGP